MKAHRIETTVMEDGTLTLKGLPFQAGEVVEIIILERHPHPQNTNLYPLHGKVYRYDEPFEPASPLEDWEALQ